MLECSHFCMEFLFFSYSRPVVITEVHVPTWGLRHEFTNEPYVSFSFSTAKCQVIRICLSANYLRTLILKCLSYRLVVNSAPRKTKVVNYC